jgi:hypothetical protein
MENKEKREERRERTCRVKSQETASFQSMGGSIVNSVQARPSSRTARRKVTMGIRRFGSEPRTNFT